MTIVHGEIDASDVTARLLFPTRERQTFAPFERFAESLATSRKKGEPHVHIGQEVIGYVLEGYIDHEDGSGKHASLTEGSLFVLTAHDEVRHALQMERGRTARWLSIVVRLPADAQPPSAPLQVTMPKPRAVAADGTIRTPLVGSSAPASTSSGLEFTDISFAKEGTTFLRLGHDRRAIAYALSGAGSVDTHAVEPGHAALLENMSGVSITGEAGFRVALVSAPLPRD